MIKSRGARGRVSVTFTIDPGVGAQNAAVCGEWNDWSADADTEAVPSAAKKAPVNKQAVKKTAPTRAARKAAAPTARPTGKTAN